MPRQSPTPSAYAEAKRLGVAPSTVYRRRKRDASAQPEPFAATMRDVGRGVTFSELGTTGLRRFGGRIDDEYDRVFRDLYKRVQLYREMADDAVVAAVDQAHRMVIRRVPWEVEAGGETEADEAAAEFVRECMDDLSGAWLDVIDNIMPMFRYGFQPAEIVWKRRQGEKREAASKYDDGRIGWRKFIFIAPESLDRGEPWLFDEHGGLQGLRQTPLTSGGASVEIPIDKLILFRTTTEKGNPEGRSLYRAMYQSWYFKHNLEEIEAISAERMGSGFPVFYLGRDVAKGDGAGGDLQTFKDMVVNVRTDDQMGLTIPYAKMGGGAREGEGVLFELVSPPSKGVVDMHQVIVRYEQRMAMVGLAQFIHLGMDGVGARALGESGQDFFTLAVTGWVDAIADTLNRFAVEPLMRLNYFPGLTAYPKIVHGPVAQTDLAQIAEYINKLAGAQLITPHPDMERALLELADMPASPDLDKAYADKAKAAAAMADATTQATLAKAKAPGEDVDQDNDPDGKKSAPTDESSWLNQEIDDMKVYEMLALFKQQGGGAPPAELVAELRRANDLFAMSLQSGGGGNMPTIKFEHGNVELPEGFGATPPIDMTPVADAIRAVGAGNQALAERFATQSPTAPVPQVQVTNTIDMQPVADALRQIPQPVVNVPPQPVQPAPIVHVAVNPEIRFPETTETIEVQRDEAGLMKSATKRRKQKRD
jgi:hypothetical protein